MFRTDPPLYIEGAKLWRLGAPLLWEDEHEAIAVPEGFLTDLASIPRAVQWLIPVNGPHRRAAILHDYLFVIQDRDRASVDRLFVQAMESDGVGWLTRRTMYAAVRAGGWMPWNKNDRALQNNPLRFLKSHGLTMNDCERNGYC